MKKHYSKIALTICITGLLIALTGCGINIGCWGKAKVKRTDELSAQLSPGSIVTVKTDFGSITVKGAETDRCDVIAKIWVQAPTKEEAEQIAEKVRIKLEPDGNKLAIKVEKPHLKNNRSIGVSFDITVPGQTSIECDTSFGSIDLSDLIGDIDVRTSFASVNAKNITGVVKLNTSYGQINGRNINSPEIKAHSSFGSIDIVCSDSTPADMIADVDTSYGSIDFTTASNFAGDVELSTSFGSIKTDLPITVKGDLGKEYIKGSVGSGSGRLSLKTSFGSIKVK